jgi:hypothetical protein
MVDETKLNSDVPTKTMPVVKECKQNVKVAKRLVNQLI